MSALDEALAYFDPGPRARACGDGLRADEYEAARAELAALRQRCEDLELIARKSLDYSGSASMRRHGDGIVLVRDVGAPIYLDDDGTGLPLLTEEARAALRGKP